MLALTLPLNAEFNDLYQLKSSECVEDVEDGELMLSTLGIDQVCSSQGIINNSNDSNVVSHMFTDAKLYEKICSVVEENELIRQQHLQSAAIRKQQQQQAAADANSAAGEDSEQPSQKAKAEVINTQTGIKYKAPMRGGHANQGTRLLTVAPSPTSSQTNSKRTI